MYLTQLKLSNAKCFREIALSFTHDRTKTDHRLNWNVILGDNGKGKTSLLRSIAALLMDASTATRVLETEGWVSRGAQHSLLSLSLEQEVGDKQQGRRPTQDKTTYTVTYAVIPGAQEVRRAGGDMQFFASPTLIEASNAYPQLFENGGTLADDLDFLKRNAFSRAHQPKNGWLSCGYGSYRRISGFSSQSATIEAPLEKRFLTLFEEGAALYDCELWLRDFARKAKKSRLGSHQRQTLSEMTQLLCELLPDVQSIDIETDGVVFEVDDIALNLHQLSDGYRSMFVLIADILRWAQLYRPDPEMALAEIRGVILIDEIDSHLHPRWQRQVGFLLTRTFPNLQFIVTSHSPYIALAAGKGALKILERESTTGPVQLRNQVPNIEGWTISQVLEKVFDVESLYSPAISSRLERYETLRQKKAQQPLSEADSSEYHSLTHELDQVLAGSDDSPAAARLNRDLAQLTSLLLQDYNG